jgi:hypothetical protein
MLYKAKVAVCSEIHTKHINAAWALPRIFESYSWWYVKLSQGFKRLRKICSESLSHTDKQIRAKYDILKGNEAAE